MNRSALQIVTPGSRTGEWRIADDESVLQLVVDGAVACVVAPWTDNKSGELVWWWATAGDRTVAVHERVVEVCRLAALDAAVAAPLSAELLRSLGESGPESEPIHTPSTVAPLLERFADLLATILDDPLTTLAGSGPEGGQDPLHLRLSHFRPELAERAAVLLEEAGR